MLGMSLTGGDRAGTPPLHLQLQAASGTRQLSNASAVLAQEPQEALALSS